MENFPNLGKEKEIHVKKTTRSPDYINVKRLTARHIVVKPAKVNDKEKNSKGSKAEENNYKGTPIRLSVDRGSFVGYLFCLAALSILSLSFTFASFTTICLAIGLFTLTYLGDLIASSTWISISFSRFGKISAIISLNKLSAQFSFSSPSVTSIILMFF